MEELIRLVRGRARGSDFFDEKKADLTLTPDNQRQAMQRVLAHTIERALKTPVYQPIAAELGKAATLEDFVALNLSTKSDIFQNAVDAGSEWHQLLGVAPDEIFLLLKTSGSTGKPKHIPYVHSMWDYGLSACAPAVTHFLENKLRSQDNVIGLALTSKEGYATYHGIPAMLAYCGIDILHAPLGIVLQNECAAVELIDKIIQNGGVDLFCTIPAMAVVLVDTLQKLPRGDQALELIQKKCSMGLFGGTVIHPRIERFLREQFGPICNCYASTESMMAAASDEHDSSVLYTTAVYSVPFIKPQNEDRYILLSDAPDGTFGELLFAIPTIPWVAVETQDLVTSVQAGHDAPGPAFRMHARKNEVLKIGNALVHPDEIRRLMDIEGITDYIVQFLPAGQHGEYRDRLQIFMEGSMSPEQLAQRIDTHTVILGDNLQNRMLCLELTQVAHGHLRGLRHAKSAENDGAVGPLKHSILTGLHYSMSEENVLGRYVK